MSNNARMCNCIGPQKGQPRCPCQMVNVIVRDGRYIQKEIDLGPARKNADQDLSFVMEGGYNVFTRQATGDI